MPDQHSDDEVDLDDLDDDFDLIGFREKRMQELAQETRRREDMKDSSYGRLTEIKSEKDLMQTVAKARTAVVHFFHKDFRRCLLMDQHLEKLAPAHPATLFLKADVANVPFLVEKLQLKVLPCLISFIEGVTKDQMVGFEGMTETSQDVFETAQLDLRLSQSGVFDEHKTGVSAAYDVLKRKQQEKGGY